VPDADFEFGPEPPITMLDPTVHFYDMSTGAPVTSWTWNFADPLNTTSSVQNPVFMYDSHGSYAVQLSVATQYGCKDSTIKIVQVSEDYMLYLPNAFTPNGDGLNEVFAARGMGVKSLKMYIYDRWGNLLFFTDDMEKGWDGTNKGEIMQEDVYVWKIELKTFKNETRQVKGTVSLVK
jgi:gliding motility-associated-like protein